MFSRVSKTAQSLLPSAVRAGITRFYSTSSVSSEVIDNISDFDPDKTRQALLHVHTHGNLKQKVDLKNLLILDSISKTSSFTTNRAYDHRGKQFLAVKTLKLDSAQEWNQVNLALRQYSFVKPGLSKVLGMDYNQERKEVKIFSELGKITLGDYCSFRVKNDDSYKTKKPWTNSELRFIYWNIVDQINTLREFGMVCHEIKPRNLFYDTNANILKLFDLSDFFIYYKGAQGFSMDYEISVNLNSVICSLVQVINPYAPVDNSEEARAYLKTNHPEFVTEFENLQKQVQEWDCQSAEVTRREIEFLLKKTPTEWFKEYDYEAFFCGKMDQVWRDLELSKSSKEWASLNHGTGDYAEAINTWRELLSKTLETHGENHENTRKIYAELTDTYRAAGNFKEASNYFEKARQIFESSSKIDKPILAQFYHLYGKFLAEKKEYSQAVQLFDLAEQNLIDSPEQNTFLAEEIKTNKKLASDLQEKKKANSNDEAEKENWFTLWNIIKLVFFVKVASIALKEIQSDIEGVLPESLLKDNKSATTESSPTNSTTIKNDQPLEKPVSKPEVQINSNFTKSEDPSKQLSGSTNNEDVSVTDGAQGSKTGSSLLFGAFLVISALGLSL